MSLLAINFLTGPVTPQCLVPALARAHHLNRVALEIDHLLRGEGATWCAWPLAHADELTGLDALLELRLDIAEREISHRPFQRVSQQRPFVDDGLAFQVPFLRERHGGARRDLRVRLEMVRALVSDP